MHSTEYEPPIMSLDLQTYYPWAELTVISITGKDRVKWLNNLVTNDVKQASNSKVIECFVTDVKGRTLSHGVLLEQNDTLLFLSWGVGQAERLISHWDRYIIREDVQLADKSTDSLWIWVNTGNSQTSIDFHPLGERWSLVQLDATQSLDAWLASVPAMTLADPMVIELDRIENRWPITGKDFDEKNLPQELDRNPSAISFTKGCYLGQETVARLDALGQVQKKLVKVEIEATSQLAPTLSANTTLRRSDLEAGYITSSVHDAVRNRWLALAYVKRAHFATGTKMEGEGFIAIVQ
jgi:tRNA-modifying protein YgfZ